MPAKTATFETAKGRIQVELFADEVPNTVANLRSSPTRAFTTAPSSIA
jgi:cyclophilin family peptidyl-prolyl cis-trans isomerase